MADVVVKLPVRAGEEAVRFGDYLIHFLEHCAQDIGLLGHDDAPVLMLHTDPQADLDLKVLTFQEGRTAHAFSHGWAKLSVAPAAA